MNAQTRALVGVAVAVGSDDHDGLIPAFENCIAAFGARDAAVPVDEVLLQSYLFVGYPRVLQAFKVWRTISATPSVRSASSDEATWAERGAYVFEKVYGAQHAKLLDNVAQLHADLERWMVVEGYGKVIGRAGLDLPVRELCIIALLATQDAAPQLYSHLRGALHVGASQEDVGETLGLALERAPAERAKRAREAWETVKTRRGG